MCACLETFLNVSETRVSLTEDCGVALLTPVLNLI